MTNKMKYPFHYYSEKEKPLQEKFADFRTKIFKPISKVLAALNIKPDHISYCGIIFLIPFIIYFKSKPLLACCFLWLSFLVDGIDGAYARYIGDSNLGGAFTDLICDQLGLIATSFALLLYNFASPILVFLYTILYLFMIVFSLVQNYLKIKIKLVIRSRLFIYIIYSIWAFFQFDSFKIPLTNIYASIEKYFNVSLFFFSVVMLITNLVGYFKLKKKFEELSDLEDGSG